MQRYLIQRPIDPWTAEKRDSLQTLFECFIEVTVEKRIGDGGSHADEET